MSDRCPEWPKGLKRTRARLAVWDTLKDQTRPVSAALLFERLLEKHSDVSLSSVYRNLEAFAECQSVVRTTSPDGTATLYGLNTHRNTHLSVCIACHAVRPVSDCAYERNACAVTEDGFHVTGHRLELLGYCDDCYRKLEKAKSPSE